MDVKLGMHSNFCGKDSSRRTENKAVRKYFFEVGRYWIREIGIDGWRLDVCDEVDHSFWQGFKKAIEEVNPEAVLIGEIMHESSAFLKGNIEKCIIRGLIKPILNNLVAPS